MTQPKRNRSWSFSECPHLSECLGGPNVRSDSHSKIAGSLRRVRTFSEDYSSGSIGEFVREAELHTAAFSCSSEKPNNPLIHLSPPSYSRFRSFSHNDQFKPRCESPNFLSPSLSRRMRQSPPKLVFGQPIVAAPLPPECAGASSLSNSLLIEYLALVTTENPYGGLVEDLPGPVSREHPIPESISPPPEPKHRVRKMGATVVPCINTVLHEGDASDGSVALFPHPSTESPKARGRCVSTIYPPGGLDTLKADKDDYRLRKLSAQVEVEHLRSMQHDFERTRLFRNPHEHLSASMASPDVSSLVNQKDGRTLFTLKNISGLASRDTNINRKPSFGASLPKLKPNDATQVPVPSLGVIPAISSPTPSAHGGETKPRTISRREHNIIAPLSF